MRKRDVKDKKKHKFPQVDNRVKKPKKKDVFIIEKYKKEK